ncbi:unnamed protein product [Acanthoscelides obtectus]|uniref:Uncharacterized protein n=1 Tax=Acanthoscelides obtectus TaxID=200917 RepID=A0A9P0LCY9_ACAOB|nr:unnamed protein product [Acanthoscelides obtectus]CAK1622254.1 hypothetical protein AOBTE_LOCUS1402 [Acanthoscelides obtectus]
MGVALKAAKVQDVKNLLKKHFGEKWDTMEECSFYKNVLGITADVTASHTAATNETVEDLEEEVNEFCEGHQHEHLVERV